MKVYVVTAPEAIRGIHRSWEECRAAVAGVPGAQYQSVDTVEKAEAMLDGGGVVLPIGKFAFTDGNAAGGVGVVLGEVGEAGTTVMEVSTSVAEVFGDFKVTGLPSEAHVLAALGRLHNILAEMAGLYEALQRMPSQSSVTVVHDYEGVSAWIERRWKTKDPVVAAVVEACEWLIRKRGLDVAFRHQRGHQSTWVGRDDYAHWNGRADELATRGPNHGEAIKRRSVKEDTGGEKPT